MKRTGIALLLALCLAAFTGCGSTETAVGHNAAGDTAVNAGEPYTPPAPGADRAENGSERVLLSVDEVLKVTPMRDLKGGQDKFTRPFYRSQIQYDEGFFLLAEADGTIAPVDLAFPAAEVLEVRSNDLKTLYREGTDYTVNEAGQLVIPAGSAMTAMTQEAFFTAGSDTWLYYDGSDYRPVTNNTDALYAHQYTVTYIRTEAFGLDMSAVGQADNLTHFSAKVQAGDDITVLVLGDSIAAGAGVKAFGKWADQVAAGIDAATAGSVSLVNAAVPGIHSAEYAAIMKEAMGLLAEGEGWDQVAAGIRTDAETKWNDLIVPNAAEADLAIIAVGANDAGGWCGATGKPVEEYASSVRTMIDYVRAQNPDVSVVLVSSMQTNPYIYTNSSGEKLAAADFGAYAEALNGIVGDIDYENSLNAAFADVYAVEEELLKSKKIEDMLGDNRNHPSDYMTRIYVQVILDTIL